MLAGQTWRASDGYEIMLFPLDEMYITQGEHNGYCIDFVGWSNMTGQIPNYPIYAPCSCKCVARSSSGDWQAFDSLDKVHCADGVLRNISFQIGHDNNPQQVGATFNQGDLIGHTGTNGQVTGDHLHFNTAGAHYTAPWSGQFNNSMHIYDICYVNDTILYRPLSYPWREYQGPPTPPTPTDRTGKKFPWVLYARKLRSKR